MFFMGGTIYWDIFDGIPGASFDPSPRDRFVLEDLQIPGLANIQKTMEHHHFSWANQLFRLGHFQ
jgi:hypothetical protein